jgi:hypothetical protein
MGGGNTVWIILAIVLVLAIVCCLTVACVGGALFLVSSSETSSGSSGPKPVEKARVSDFCAEYQVIDPERGYDEYHGTITFNCDMTMSFVETVEGEGITGQGTWSFDESSLTFSFESEAGARFSGTTRGNTDDFTIDGQWSNGVEGKVRLTR